MGGGQRPAARPRNGSKGAAAAAGRCVVSCGWGGRAARGQTLAAATSFARCSQIVFRMLDTMAVSRSGGRCSRTCRRAREQSNATLEAARISCRRGLARVSPNARPPAGGSQGEQRSGGVPLFPGVARAERPGAGLWACPVAQTRRARISLCGSVTDPQRLQDRSAGSRTTGGRSAPQDSAPQPVVRRPACAPPSRTSPPGQPAPPSAAAVRCGEPPALPMR